MDKKEFIHIRAFFHDMAFDILARTQRDDINMILECLLEGWIKQWSTQSEVQILAAKANSE